MDGVKGTPSDGMVVRREAEGLNGGCSSVGQSAGLWFLRSWVRNPLPTLVKSDAPVAQLDRASDFESEGRRFESYRVYVIFVGV